MNTKKSLILKILVLSVATSMFSPNCSAMNTNKDFFNGKGYRLGGDNNNPAPVTSLTSRCLRGIGRLGTRTASTAWSLPKKVKIPGALAIAGVGINYSPKLRNFTSWAGCKTLSGLLSGIKWGVANGLSQADKFITSHGSKLGSTIWANPYTRWTALIATILSSYSLYKHIKEAPRSLQRMFTRNTPKNKARRRINEIVERISTQQGTLTHRQMQELLALCAILKSL